MNKTIHVPQLGFTTQYVTISKWYVKPGDQVNEGQVILGIESEKTAMDVESSYSGVVLELLKSEGEEADVGEAVLVLEV